MRWLLSVLVIVGLVVGPVGVAEAAVLRDGETFSIDLSEARICFVAPPELRSDEECLGLKGDRIAQRPDAPRLKRLATGMVRVPGSQTSPRLLAIVEGSRLETRNPAEPTPAGAQELAGGYAKGLAGRLPPSAKVGQPTGRLLMAGDVPVMRITVEVEGLAPGTDEELQAHHEVVVVLANHGTYVIEWSGPAKNAIAIAHLADASIPSIHRDPKESPRGMSIVTLVLPFAAFGLVGLVIGFVVLLVRRSGARPNAQSRQ